MKQLLLSFLLTFGSLHIINAQTSNLEDQLFDLPDVSFKKIASQNDTGVTYELKVKQPLDHTDPQRGFFDQKVYLSHKDFNLPTVIVTQGHSVNRNREQELTRLLNANQVNVEHRFFGESLPDSMDYRYLNLKQATADLHHIRELLGQLYKEQWISTGISKGGATTIFYRYFYPEDVDVSVPYVAPINQSYEEPRIYHFLDTVGSKACRNKIKAFQTQVLKNRDEILPLIAFYAMGAGVNYSYLSIGEAFEYAVMEYPFAVWQYGISCSAVPAKSATTEAMAKHLISVSDPTFFSDELIERYTSHYYQSATEMGYYGYETSEFKDLLIDLPTDTNPMCLFFPFELTDKFDGTLLNDINNWLKTEGNQFIYIYGGSDTWSASAVPENDQVDAEWFMMAGKHHGNARIREMTGPNQERLVHTLEKWLGRKIENPFPQ